MLELFFILERKKRATCHESYNLIKYKNIKERNVSYIHQAYYWTKQKKIWKIPMKGLNTGFHVAHNPKSCLCDARRYH